MKALGKKAVGHMSRQESATWAVVAALLFVILYSWWGATVLNHERQAQAIGSSVVHR